VASAFRRTGYDAARCATSLGDRQTHELQGSIERALVHRGPTLIDARIDPAGDDVTLRAMRG